MVLPLFFSFDILITQMVPSTRDVVLSTVLTDGDALSIEISWPTN